MNRKTKNTDRNNESDLISLGVTENGLISIINCNFSFQKCKTNFSIDFICI